MDSVGLDAAPTILPPAARLAEPAWIVEAADVQGWTWARVAWQRAAHVPGAWYDVAKADYVVALWPTIFRLTEDRFAGQPFHLSPWQEVVVRLVVGWKVQVEVLDPATRKVAMVSARLFRALMLWVPRKNGKSEFLAALALLFFVLDGVAGGQGFAFARNKAQATIPFDKMKAIVRADARLAEKVMVFQGTLWVAELASRFELLTGKPEGKHGRSPTVILGDEMHEWVTIDLVTFLRQGTGARLQPIELYASTAGLKSAHVGYGLFDESRKLLAGPITPPDGASDEGHGLYDPSTLVVMFAAEDDDDWQDEAVWRRANPNLGLSPTIDFLRREAKRAKNNPRAESAFRRYHLNQWVEAISRWIPIRKWDDCAPDPTAWRRYGQELRGERCVGAFDISSTRDVTALVFVFPPTPDCPRMRLVCRFFVPEENVDTRSKVDRVDYDRFIAAGAMEVTPGDYVDQSYVQRALEEGLAAYQVDKIGFDPWNATKLYTDLQNAGVSADRFLQVRQGVASLGEASKEFERLVFAGLLDHGGHPVLRWMVGNALIRFDLNMNFVPDKKHSREKIDGVTATVTALAALGTLAAPGPSLDDFLANAVVVNAG